MSEKNLQFVPLATIIMAMEEATEGVDQYLDLQDMKVGMVPEDPEGFEGYVEDKEFLEALKKDVNGERFILLPSEEEMEEHDDEYDFTDINNLRLFALQWCQERGLSTLDDVDLIGKRNL